MRHRILQGRTLEFRKGERGGGGGGSDMNNQQGGGGGGGGGRGVVEAFGGPALVHWMIRYITWGVVNCFR